MEFKSAVTRGGNIVLPEIITVTEQEVTWKKRNKILISSDSISIPITSISSVEIDTNIVGTTIKIKSNGQGEILGSNFTASDAKEIKRLINQFQIKGKQSKNDKEYITGNKELELKQFEQDKYYDIERIPLIEFSQDTNESISELNKLTGLYRDSLREGEEKKSEAYLVKINEGLRFIMTSGLTEQQSRLVDLLKSDLHNLTIKNYLFKGLSVSLNNDERCKTILHFIWRNKWWTLFIVSLIYVVIRNFLDQN